MHRLKIIRTYPETFPVILIVSEKPSKLKARVTFRSLLVFIRWRVVSPLPSNHQPLRAPVIGCLPLPFQYTRSFPPHLEAVFIRNLRTDRTVVTRGPFTTDHRLKVFNWSCEALLSSVYTPSAIGTRAYHSLSHHFCKIAASSFQHTLISIFRRFVDWCTSAFWESRGWNLKSRA